MIDLLVVGDCNPDLILAGGDVVPEFGQTEKLVDDARLLVGGSAAIAACGAARLGLSVALVAAVGDDLFGRFMLEQLAARRVDVSACPAEPDWETGLTVALVRGGDRAMLTAPGAIPALAARHVPDRLLAGTRHLHVASYFLLDGLRDAVPSLVETAHAAGATVSLDPQGDPSGRWDAGLPALAASLDVLFVNEQEHGMLAASGSPLTVVKRGARGATALAGDERVDAAPPAVNVVDATGAGDSFDAGFIAGRLRGLGLAESLALACACGAMATRALGGTAAQPTFDEALAAVR
ncbi:MAG TPA: PfkB family carbohydrate kinase [Gaiellales bacterium]|nr:PfkB family carbohydrate kinase [Gaiellales bacterium]